MLKVFISSTFRDLKGEREKIIDALDQVLEVACMEKFIPNGSTSNKKSIAELENSDLVVFLISGNYYGTILDKCEIKKCKVKNCVMRKKHIRDCEKISYTHCEYRFALGKNKPHMTYIVKGKKLKDEKSKSFIKEIREIEIAPKIRKNKASINNIIQSLPENLVKWYEEGKIKFWDFAGRRNEVSKLFQKLNKGESIEIYGVGGIGKTTLAHLVLLLQRLKGKKIIALSRNVSYITGCGYKYFRQEVNEYKLITNKITLSELIEALNLPSELKTQNDREKIEEISNKVKKEELVIFIDDFQNADDGVKELVKELNNTIICSRVKIGIFRNEIPLKGVDEKDKLIDIKCKDFNIEISRETKNKIKKIADGHPVLTEILIRNYQKIDFSELKSLKSDLAKEHSDEFFKRVIEEVLSKNALNFLKEISIINTDLDTNLDRKTLLMTYKNKKIFNELIETNFLTKKKEGIYQFSSPCIKDVMQEDSKENHEKAVNYYENKKNQYGSQNEDTLEIIFHKAKSNPSPDLICKFKNIEVKGPPHFLGRLIEVGKALTHVSPNKDDQVSVHQILGYAYMTLADYKSAVKELNQAEKLYPLNNCKKELCVITAQYLAECYRLTGNYEKALDYLNWIEKFGGLCPLFIAYWGKSLTYKLQDKIVDAFDLCEKAEKLWKEIKESGNNCAQFGAHEFDKKDAHLYRHKAELLRYMGDYKGALDCLTKFFLIYSEEDWPAFGYGKLLESHVFRMEGNFQKAKTSAKQAMKQFQNKEIRGYLSAIRALGQIAFGSKNDKEAKKCFQKLLDSPAYVYPHGQIYGHLGMAEIFRLNNHLNEAKLHYQKAIRLCNELKGKVEIAYAYSGLAEICRVEGEFSKGLDFLNKAQDIGKKCNHPWIQVYSNLIKAMLTPSKADKFLFLEQAFQACRQFKRRSPDKRLEEEAFKEVRNLLENNNQIQPLRFNFP